MLSSRGSEKKVLLILLVGIFMVGVVSAGNCDKSQIIMKLSSSTNAHGALWNDTELSSYYYHICYDEIFGGPYGGSNPHKCADDGSNKVLSLFNETNAHASILDDDINYAVDVCYGNLVCEDRENCEDDEEIVARMYYENNSHISNASDGHYNITICCSSKPIWQNMNGVEITEADVGDTVRMVLAGGKDLAGLDGGEFEVFEEGGGGILGTGNDPIRTIEGGNKITGIPDRDFTKDGLIENGNLIGYWTIKAEDLAETENDYDGFFFKIGEKTSNHLTISKSPDDDPMELKIESPSCGWYSDSDSSWKIRIIANDNDHLITGNVKIGDDTWIFSNGGLIVNDYPWKEGTIPIKVFANNSAGYVWGLVSNVIVTNSSSNGNYIAACIDEPANFDDIKDSSTIEFNASSTQGRNCINGYCTQILITDLLFSWTFSEGSTWNKYGDEPQAYEFRKTFATSGSNWATLNVSVKSPVT